MKNLRFFFLSILLVFPVALLSAQPWRQAGPPSDPSYEMQAISCMSDGNKIYGEAFIPKAPG